MEVPEDIERIVETFRDEFTEEELVELRHRLMLQYLIQTGSGQFNRLLTAIQEASDAMEELIESYVEIGERERAILALQADRKRPN